jgi:hypothetical protein
MREALKKFWGKVKPIVIAVLGIIIGVSWTYFYITFSTTYREAEAAWNEVPRIHQLNADFDSSKQSGGEEVKASSFDKEAESGEYVSTTTPPIGEILPKIHQLESSGGKNDSCKQKGKVNGYGYMQSKFHWVCFDSKEEVEKEVAKWFEKNLQNKTLAESLCYYNKGIITSDCEYAKKFASIKI